jgi:hypothetical protein
MKFATFGKLIFRTRVIWEELKRKEKKKPSHKLRLNFALWPLFYLALVRSFTYFLCAIWWESNEVVKVC